MSRSDPVVQRKNVRGLMPMKSVESKRLRGRNVSKTLKPGLASKGPSMSDATKSPVRTLLINCNPDRATIQAYLLEQAMSIEIVGRAVDGRQGLRLATTTDPDLIITCIQLMFVSGLDLIRELRKTNQVVAIVVATAGSLTMQYEALAAGANACLQDPFTSEQLVSTVRKVLN